mmetsp:Transcript_22820/g.27491  ORF Transcript_22820/g.27491 Transcript_22820/m.27491 type:complete len:301 (+) Transcript_22820:444-1346(+)
MLWKLLWMTSVRILELLQVGDRVVVRALQLPMHPPHFRPVQWLVRQARCHRLSVVMLVLVQLWAVLASPLRIALHTIPPVVHMVEDLQVGATAVAKPAHRLHSTHRQVPLTVPQVRHIPQQALRIPQQALPTVPLLQPIRRLLQPIRPQVLLIHPQVRLTAQLHLHIHRLLPRIRLQVPHIRLQVRLIAPLLLLIHRLHQHTRRQVLRIHQQVRLTAQPLQHIHQPVLHIRQLVLHIRQQVLHIVLLLLPTLLLHLRIVRQVLLTHRTMQKRMTSCWIHRIFTSDVEWLWKATFTQNNLI